MAVRFLDHVPIYMDAAIKFAKQQWNRVASRQDVLDFLTTTGDASVTHQRGLCLAEARFLESGKPFFNVYPKVIEALAKTSLDVRPDDVPRSIVHEVGSLAVKFPVGCEFERRHNIGWFFMAISDGVFAVMYSSNHHSKGMFGSGYINSWGILSSSSFSKSNFVFVGAAGDSKDDVAEKQIARITIARIAIGVLMLAADPDFIKPVLLKADEGKPTPLEERIARAKKRGVYGFTIGEDIETCPHFRRPHFAVRWTGKGATIPKLVPVKGSVINKKLMTTVPTGYEDQVPINAASQPM